MNLIMEMKSTCVAVFLIIILGSDGFSYISTHTFILGEVAKHQGKGAYLIEQELLFKNTTESLSLTERWLIKNEQEMSVVTKTPGYHYFATYLGRNKRMLNELGDLVPAGLGVDFVETYFHARSPSALVQQMLRDGIVPPGAFPPAPKKPKDLADFSYSLNPFLRLVRVDGTVSDCFGPSTGEASAGFSPGACYEQDRFVTKRIRFKDQAEVRAETYGAYSQGLSFPKVRVFQWNGNSVRILTHRVDSISSSDAAFKQMNPPEKHLKFGFKDTSLTPQIREFYTRFR